MKELLELKIREIIRETTDTISLVLENTDRTNLNYIAGQFLTFLFNINGKELRRSFSLSSAPDTDKYPAVTIKRMENGEISRYIFDHIRQGDILTSLYPTGKFTLPAATPIPRDIFLVGGGSGITPLFALLKTVLQKMPQHHTTLLYANHNETSTIFYRQLNVLQEENPHRFTLIYFFSNPSGKSDISAAGGISAGKHPDLPAGEPLTPGGDLNQGRLNNSLLEELVNSHFHYEKNKAEFFLCGPASLMRMAQLTLIFMGFRKDQVHRENFVSPVLTTSPHTHALNAVSSRATLHFRGQKHTIIIPAGENILQAALDKGIQIPYSCRGGLCSACSGRCTKGKVNMLINEVLTDRDVANGWVLTCVGIPQTEELEIDFDLPFCS